MMTSRTWSHFTFLLYWFHHILIIKINNFADLNNDMYIFSAVKQLIVITRIQNKHFYIYIYAFSRRFYPKRLTLHSSYSFYILEALAFPGNRTHDLSVANAMLYQLSYRKAFYLHNNNL